MGRSNPPGARSAILSPRLPRWWTLWVVRAVVVVAVVVRRGGRGSPWVVMGVIVVVRAVVVVAVVVMGVIVVVVAVVVTGRAGGERGGQLVYLGLSDYLKLRDDRLERLLPSARSKRYSPEGFRLPALHGGDEVVAELVPGEQALLH